ncbi:outer membrane beta-barrel protein [Thaumasiovibrio sp. DFM-14]|uniref:outer membrane beta-barrel protein n=1 Tax=Thaumasiovibrio sp. DFM-14 TaxID=3384792 RepID=UPI00399EEDB7
MFKWLRLVFIIGMGFSSTAMAFEFSLGTRVGGVQQKANSSVRSMKDNALAYGVESTFIAPVGTKIALGVNVTADKFDVEFEDYAVRYNNSLYTGSVVVGYRFDNIGEFGSDNSLLYAKLGAAKWRRQYKDGRTPNLTESGTELLYGLGFKYTNDKNLYTGIEFNYFSMDTSPLGRLEKDDMGKVDNLLLMLTAGYRF